MTWEIEQMKTSKQEPEEKLFVYVVPNGRLQGQIFNLEASDSNILIQMNMEIKLSTKTAFSSVSICFIKKNLASQCI